MGALVSWPSSSIIDGRRANDSGLYFATRIGSSSQDYFIDRTMWRIIWQRSDFGYPFEIIVDLLQFFAECASLYIIDEEDSSSSAMNEESRARIFVSIKPSYDRLSCACMICICTVLFRFVSIQVFLVALLVFSRADVTTTYSERCLLS